jgi:hypothetical protein
MCSGETHADAEARARAFGGVILPDEAPELCVEDLNPTIVESFLLVRCTYFDKKGGRKGGDDQEGGIPRGFTYPTEESDNPAKEIRRKYHTDERVIRYLALTPQPRARQLPTPP